MLGLVYAYVKYVLLFLLLIMLIPVTALWSNTLRVNVLVTVKQADLDIGSWRVFVKYACDVCRGIEDGYVNLSEDKDTIYVYLDSIATKYVWVGLVIENSHEVPATLEDLQVSFTNSSGTYELSVDNYTIYAYEPIKEGVGNKPYWGELDCDDLPIQDYLTELPVVIDSGWKAVLWVKVDTHELSNGDLTLKLIYSTGSNST